MNDSLWFYNQHNLYPNPYRTNYLSVVDTYQMSDLRDNFEREPFGVRFSSPTTSKNAKFYPSILTFIR